MINVIAAKRTLGFSRKNEDGKVEKAVAAHKELCSLPDWVKNDPMYKLAVKAGELKVSGAIVTAAGTDISPEEPPTEPPTEPPKKDNKTPKKES